MVNIIDLSVEQMKRIIAIKAQIQALNEELEKIVSGSSARTVRRGKAARVVIAASNGNAKPVKKKRKMTAAWKAKIGAATKARWDKYRAEKAAKAKGK